MEYHYCKRDEDALLFRPLQALPNRITFHFWLLISRTLQMIETNRFYILSPDILKVLHSEGRIQDVQIKYMRKAMLRSTVLFTVGKSIWDSQVIEECILFGFPLNNYVIHVLNFWNLYAKYYIYIQTLY